MILFLRQVILLSKVESIDITCPIFLFFTNFIIFYLLIVSNDPVMLFLKANRVNCIFASGKRGLLHILFHTLKYLLKLFTFHRSYYVCARLYVSQ